ncbi:MAG: hypothetical protein SGBAC_003533 [Bacillariaceae sp.]
MTFLQPFILSCFVLVLTLRHCRALQSPIPPVALITGATGRTGQLVSDLLLQQGFHLRIFCREEAKARAIFESKNSKCSQQDGGDGEHCVIEYFSGDLKSIDDVKAAFQTSSTSLPLTHFIFLAGGEDADYKGVNYYGVKSMAKLAVQSPSIRQIVLVSTAWATRPYSIASLLFNTLYPHTIPMASHYLGEQALRRAVASSNANNPSSSETNGSNINYVILRAGGLNSDDRWKKKYPEASAMGLTYAQGDSFTFAGIAGRPGMCRSQLANAVLAATTAEGGYTVEVTGSGPTEWKDATVYQTALQPDDGQTYFLNENPSGALVSAAEEDEIYAIHTQAVQQFKATVISVTVAGVGLITTFGFVQGLISLLFLDAIILLLWGKLLGTRQVS